MIDRNAPRAAVLVRIGGLGDLLVAVPAIALLRQVLAGRLNQNPIRMPVVVEGAGARVPSQPDPANGPAGRLKLICRPEYGVLLRETGLVDELIPAEEPALAALFAGEAPAARARETIGPAALVVGWIQNPRSPLAAADWGSLGARNVRFFAPDAASGKPLGRDFFDQTRSFASSKSCRAAVAWGAYRREGSPCRRPSDGSTTEMGGLDAAAYDRCRGGQGAGEEPFESLARLNLSEGQIRTGLEHFGFDPALRGRYAVIHPGSGSRAKRWPLENFLEIARTLADAGRPGVIVTGEAESDLEPVLRETRLPSGWRWRGGSPPVLRLAGMLGGAGLYLGNDSGVTHLAGAAGATGLALFRRGWLPAWRPAGSVRILAAESPADIPVDGVRAEIERLGLLPL